MENDLQSLAKGLERNIWIMRREIRVLIPLRLDEPIFIKDVPRVSTFVRDGGGPSITYQGSPKEYIDHDKGDMGPCSPKHGCTCFS